MLSKSQYVRGLQCLKSLWLLKNQKALKREPTPREQANFETGHHVGSVACQLFPNGTEIAFTPNDFDGMVTQTKALMEAGETIIYEATFKEKGVFVMVDILVKSGDAWNIYEVKASTQVKPYHLDDASVQWYALCDVLPLNKAFIVHINNQYVKQGDIEPEQLFIQADVTNEVLAKQSNIQAKVTLMEQTININQPDITIGVQCDDPHECDFKHHCWQHIPSPSVFDLYRMRKNKKFELYRQGIVQLGNIPASQKLSDIQQVQVNSHLNQQSRIDKDVIQQFVNTVEYPVHFFDFETFTDAIPRFDGQSPYKQMPFQYSLHILHDDGTLEHKEFIADEHADPREPLTQNMLNDILSTGSIVAFNQGFEKGVIKTLANEFAQYETQLLSLNERFVDLIDPFRQIGFYHPNFNGSFSIKSILPALFPNDPELNYKSLVIQDGGMAMDTYAKLHQQTDVQQREQIRQDLFAYCRLDTLAMVKIYEKLVSTLKHHCC